MRCSAATAEARKACPTRSSSPPKAPKAKRSRYSSNEQTAVEAGCRKSSPMSKRPAMPTDAKGNARSKTKDKNKAPRQRSSAKRKAAKDKADELGLRKSQPAKKSKDRKETWRKKKQKVTERSKRNSSASPTCRDRAAQRSQDPTLSIPVRSLANVNFNEKRGIIEMGRRKQARTFLQRRHGEEIHADRARRRRSLRTAARQPDDFAARNLLPHQAHD